MNNRFKFRVWDIVNSKYIPGNRLHVNHDGSLSSCIENIIIEQCTGLSALQSYRGDKPEDLLIWEGDIIRNIIHNEYIYKMEVVWLKTSAEFGFAIDAMNIWNGDDLFDVEIIGNIHEDEK